MILRIELISSERDGSFLRRIFCELGSGLETHLSKIGVHLMCVKKTNGHLK